MFWLKTAAYRRGSRRGNTLGSSRMIVLPGPIGVAAVSADHEVTIAFGDRAATAAFGILDLLHVGARHCRLLNGTGINWQGRRALAGDDTEPGGET